MRQSSSPTLVFACFAVVLIGACGRERVSAVRDLAGHTCEARCSDAGCPVTCEQPLPMPSCLDSHWALADMVPADGGVETLQLCNACGNAYYTEFCWPITCSQTNDCVYGCHTCEASVCTRQQACP